MTATTTRLATTTDVVAFIAATTAEAIANKGAASHDLDTVMARMTEDGVLGQIRSAYLRRVNAGQDPKAAMTKVAVNLITEYRTHYGV